MKIYINKALTKNDIKIDTNTKTITATVWRNQ